MPPEKRPNLLIGLRLDCAELMLELSKHFNLIPFPDKARETVQSFHIPATPVMGVDLAQFIADSRESVAAAVAVTHILIDEYKPVGCVLWNTVQSQRRAVALTCRLRGVPVFEINHWAISTYLIGHFEAEPTADFIYASPEYQTFLEKSSENIYTREVLPMGRPQYDRWALQDRFAAREALGLEVEGPYVLVTSTWTHYLTQWSSNDWAFDHQLDTMHVLKTLQDQFPQLKVLWSTRFTGTAATITGRLNTAGIAAHVTDDTPLVDLINAADIVVTQKSGVIADSLVMGKPVICVDYHPQADWWAWRPFGALHAHNKNQLARYLIMLMKKPRAREIVAAGMARARAWYGYVEGGCSAAIAEDIKKRCANFSSLEAQEPSAWRTSNTATGKNGSSSSRGTSRSTKHSGNSTSRTSD